MILTTSGEPKYVLMKGSALSLDIITQQYPYLFRWEKE